MKKALLLIVTLVTVGCSGPRPYRDDPFLAGSEACVSVVVDNRNFADAVVWVGESRRIRLGTVTGLTRESYSVCRWHHVRAVFEVHAIGGAFDFRRRASHTRLDPTRPLRLVIGPTANLSYVVGKRP